MSTEIPPSPQVKFLQEDLQKLKIRGLMTTFAGLVWSIVIMLFIGCCRAVRNPAAQYSKRKQTAIYYLWTVRSPDLIVLWPVFLPFCLWGADGFLVWRCLMLYGNPPQGRRSIFRCSLFLLALLSFGSGILFFIPIDATSFTPQLVSSMALIALTSISILNNGVLTGLIIHRITYHRKSIALSLGDSSRSIYSRIITLCIESCVLILTCEVPLGPCMALLNVEDAIILYAMFSIAPHGFVLSAFLLILRVAGGRDVATTLTVSQLNDIEMRQGVPRFNNRTSIGTNSCELDQSNRTENE